MNQQITKNIYLGAVGIQDGEKVIMNSCAHLYQTHPMPHIPPPSKLSLYDLPGQGTPPLLAIVTAVSLAQNRKGEQAEFSCLHSGVRTVAWMVGY